MPTYFQQKIITLVIVLAVLAAIFVGVIVPSLRDINELQTKILTERTELEERYSRRISTKLTLQNLAKLNRELPNLAAEVLAERGKEIRLIALLENLAEKHALTHMIRLEPNLAVPLSRAVNIVSVPILLTLKGDFASLLQYLSDMENNYFMISPQAITISIKALDPNLDIKIEAASFWK